MEDRLGGRFGRAATGGGLAGPGPAGRGFGRIAHMAALHQLPLGFSRVADGVYRSAYPGTRTLPFLSSLNLRSLVCLNPKDVRSELRDYAKQHSLRLFEGDVGVNQEPFLVMSSFEVDSVLRFVSDPTNHPVLIFCTNGKVRTGTVVGCLRKQMGWSIVSIFHELEQATDGDATLADQLFIEQFLPMMSD